MGKIRVLLLVNRWYPDGGVENFLEQLVSETSGSIDYAIMSLTTRVDSDAACIKIGPVLSSERVQDMFAQSSSIASVMREGHYDVVHIKQATAVPSSLLTLQRKRGSPVA